MKKWVGITAALALLAAIGLFAISVHNRDVDYYLKVAEKAVKQGNDDLTIINLELALDKSKEVNGEVSLESADIYRKMGQVEKNWSTASEYFDRAILIYEIEGKAETVPEILCEKGLMLAKGGRAASDLAEETYQKVIDSYQENDYKDVTFLCMGYCMISQFAKTAEEQLAYLKQAENLLERVSTEKQAELCDAVYRGTALVNFIIKDYHSSLEYWEKLLALAEDGYVPSAKDRIAEACQMSGACLAYLSRAQEARSRGEKAIALYEEIGSDIYYDGMALSYASLALAYASQEEPDIDKTMEYSRDSLTCYTSREKITNIDMANMAGAKLILKDAYLKAHPNSEEEYFENWYFQNSQMKAASYYFYTK